MRRALIFLATVIAAQANAATWLVGPGQTYTSLSAIDSAAVQPGDTVQLQAASPGGTYTFFETFAPSWSGTAGNRITVQPRAGDSIGIDGGLTNLYALSLNRISFVTFRNLNWSNTLAYVWYAYGGCTNIVMSYCTNQQFFTGSGTNSTKDMSVFQGYSNVFDHCYAINERAPYEAANDCDGLDMPNSSGGVISNCTIVIQSSATDQSGQHNDGIQCWNATNITICGNHIYMPVQRNYQQGIYLEWYWQNGPNFGTNRIFNNMIEGYGGSYLMQFDRHAIGGSNAVAAVCVWNNTVHALNQSASVLFHDTYDGTLRAGDDYVEDFNNIFWSDNPSDLYALLYGPGSASAGAVNSDYNLVWVTNALSSSQVVFYGTAQDTWAQWQAAGFDTHSIGILTSPKLNSDYTVQSGSPVIGAGTNLSSFFAVDITGTTRSSWDIGAYAYVSDPAITVEPQNVTVTAPATATFTVTATTGSPPLAYQWSKNGSAISGATLSSYTTPATTTGDNGELFACQVCNSTNACVTSASALLTVNSGGGGTSSFNWTSGNSTLGNGTQ